MIRRAMLTDLESLLMIKDLVITDMAKYNIFQWDHAYPTAVHFEQDIAVSYTHLTLPTN